VPSAIESPSAPIKSADPSTVPSLAQHPLKTFLEHGVLASINTDDPAVQEQLFTVGVGRQQ
jgi:adenosine deaminase